MSKPGRLELSWRGTDVDIRLWSEELAAALALMFQPFVTTHEAPIDTATDSWRAEIGAEKISRGSLGETLFAVEEVVAQRLFHRAEGLLLHSGAVAKGDQTVMILGPSGSGKTTTTLEFIRRGYRYLADEYTAIDVDGTFLHPFPRSFVLKEQVLPLPPGERFVVARRRALFQPDRVADLAPHRIGRLSVIFPHFHKEARPTVREMSSADLCRQLLHNSFVFEHREAELWPALSTLAVSARGCDLDYRDIATDLDLAVDYLGC